MGAFFQVDFWKNLPRSCELDTTLEYAAFKSQNLNLFSATEAKFLQKKIANVRIRLRKTKCQPGFRQSLVSHSIQDAESW